MKPTKPWKKGLNLKLGLGVAALLILGLGLIFGIVNTIVRGLVYDNVSGIVLRSKIAHAAEIDEFFGSVAKMVRGLAISLGTLPSEEHFAAIAESFVAEYDFIENVTIGFSDGRVISAVGWLASDGWGFANRPWYAAAAAAGAGVFVVTEPFVSSPLGGIAIAKATWAPGIGGVGGAVSASVPMYHVFELVAGREVMANGYLILVGPDGKILAHPDVEYSPAIYGADSVWTLNIRSIPNGDFLMDSISAGQTVTEFQDYRLGRSYLITIPLEITGWTLAAVIPVAATREPMFQFLALVMVALAIVLLGLFILSAIFFSRLTKNMEESSLAEQRLRLIFDHLPFASTFRDRKRNLLNCNAETVRLFGVKDTQEYMHRSPELSPEFQPDGSVSREKAGELIEEAFENGGASFDWMHQTLDGEPIPTEVTLIRIEQSSGAYLLSFIKDMREHYEAQRKERLVMQRMQTLLDTSPLVCLVLDEHCNVLEANREVERLFEIPDRKTFMESFFDFSPARQPDGALSRDKMIAEIGKALESEKSRCEWTHQTLKGKHIPCEAIFESVKIDGRNLVMTYVRDLRDFHKYRKTERVAQQRLQAMLDSSPLACSIFDENFNVQEVNHELLALFDVADRRSYIGRFSEFSPRYQPDGRSSGEKFREKVKVALDMGRIHFEWMHQTLRGSPIPCEVTIVRVYLDDKPLLICYTRDLRKINETFAMVKHLEKLAFTDTLTGARNRRYFTETAERELYSCVDDDRDFAIIIFDIDNFKLVNDVHGHIIGDEVLKIIVARVCHALKQDTLVARYGGEEFVVMLLNVGHENAMKIAWQLQKKIDETPFLAEGVELRITVSLGVASKTATCAVLQDIVANADRALYRAKQTGKNKAVSYEEISREAAGGASAQG